MRPRCSVFIALSLDGFIARPDGGIDWLSGVQIDGEDFGYAEFFKTVGALVMGRKTWEVACGFETWPYASKRCIVLTKRPAISSHGEEFYSGDLAALLDRLGTQGVPHVYVDGGTVITQFLRDRLVDDLTLSFVPIVLGRGIRLFEAETAEQRFHLKSSRSWPTGLVQLRYDRTPNTP